MGNCSTKECFDFMLSRSAQQSRTIQTTKPNYWRIGAGNHKIVVGIGAKDFGGSTQCLNFALQLANEGDEVVALHVRTDVGDILNRLADLEHVYNTEITSKKIKYDTIVTNGNPRHEILSKSLDADMLMVGAGHKGFGSMTRFVCEYAKVNVVVVKKVVKLKGRILVGIGANDLYGSLSALKLAFDIANNGEEITALYIPVSTNMMGGEWKNREVLGRRSLEIGRQANDVIRMVRERADALSTTFAQEGKTVNFKFEYKEGEFDRAAIRIELMREAASARLVVLGSGRKGFGSVARYVVENLHNCPIVLAKFVRAQHQTHTETDV